MLAACAAGRTQDADFIPEHIPHTFNLLLDRSRLLADPVAPSQGAVAGLPYRLPDGTTQVGTDRGIDAPVTIAAWPRSCAGRAEALLPQVRTDDTL
ncbi:hypothetical protein OV450_3696 [Actinobacteria bacterium OV450]|nr:hypothetical protein OV450_3696 [Actinobacteria bacterium OV450]